MTTFLFWNLGKNFLETIIANLAWRHDVDVFMFAECTIPIPVMLKALNPKSAQYHFAPSDCDKIAIYTKFRSQFLQPVLETGRLTVRKLEPPGLVEILLAVIHFPSKLHWSDSSQAFECTQLSKDIRKAEQEIGHSRTILVGDLNMNPFENGVLGASGLNAVMTRRIAQRGTRIVQGRQYPFFYNPMWGHFGDGNQGPPGTFYYQGSGHVTSFWHIVDQVLIRSDLLDHFQNESLEILSTDGALSFLSTQGRPNHSVASDHLPILFKLNL